MVVHAVRVCEGKRCLETFERLPKPAGGANGRNMRGVAS